MLSFNTTLSTCGKLLFQFLCAAYTRRRAYNKSSGLVKLVCLGRRRRRRG